MVSNSSLTIRRTLLVMIVLLIYAPYRHTAAAQGTDFGFRFESGMCWTDRLDTFSGVFTQNLGGLPPRTVTAQISLTDAQMRTIHQMVDDIRFFEYPSTFDGVPPGLWELRSFSPFLTYRL